MTANKRFLGLLIAGLVGFVILSQGLGEWYGLYNKVWWWDDALHAVSGILFALVGLFVLRIFEHDSMKPISIALFAFCFAITCGVMWEIYEFALDAVFGFTMQQWNMPPNAVVIGKTYQGMGLRDTMQDLILATVGAVFTSGALYAKLRRIRSTVSNDR